jgi:hypothetical protein
VSRSQSRAHFLFSHRPCLRHIGTKQRLELPARVLWTVPPANFSNFPIPKSQPPTDDSPPTTITALTCWLTVRVLYWPKSVDHSVQIAFCLIGPTIEELAAEDRAPSIVLTHIRSPYCPITSETRKTQANQERVSAGDPRADAFAGSCVPFTLLRPSPKQLKGTFTHSHRRSLPSSPVTLPPPVHQSIFTTKSIAIFNTLLVSLTSISSHVNNNHQRTNLLIAINNDLNDLKRGQESTVAPCTHETG